VSYGRLLESAVFLYGGICADGVRVRRVPEAKRQSAIES
jgi:hypothetical protein